MENPPHMPKETTQKIKTPPKEKRVHFLKTRVTPTERIAALENAKRAGISLSELQRRVIANDLIFIEGEKEQEAENRELIYHLLSIGNNINQSTKVLHILSKDFHADGEYDGGRIQRSLDNMDDSLKLLDAVLTTLL